MHIEHNPTSRKPAEGAAARKKFKKANWIAAILLALFVCLLSVGTAIAWLTDDDSTTSEFSLSELEQNGLTYAVILKNADDVNTHTLVFDRFENEPTTGEVYQLDGNNCEIVAAFFGGDNSTTGWENSTINNNSTNQYWSTYRATLTSVVTNCEIKPRSISYWFYDCSSLSGIDGLEKWDTSNTNSMSSAFKNCSSLQEIEGLENWNTQSVMLLDQMFAGCTSIRTLDLSGWEITKKDGNQSLDRMFSNCKNLYYIYTSKDADWTNVGNYSQYMFDGVPASARDANGVPSDGAYRYASDLACVAGLNGKSGYFIPKIYINYFDENNQVSNQILFKFLQKADNSDIEGFRGWAYEKDATKVELNVGSTLLYNSENITDINLYPVFKGKYAVVTKNNSDSTTYTLSFDVFKSQPVVGDIYIVDGAEAEIMAAYYSGDDTSVGWETSTAATTANQFWSAYASGLTKIIIRTSVKPISMGSWFKGCTKLFSIEDLSKVRANDTSSMNSMFSGCTSLQNVNALSDWDTTSLEDISKMFENCNSLQNVDGLAAWNTSAIKYMSYIFYNCTALTGVDSLSDWNTKSASNLSYMFYGCTSLIDIDPLATWDTSAVTNVSYMFWGCYELNSIKGIKDWDTSKITSMSYMFYGCSSLQSIDALSNWITSKLASIDHMFDGCSSLISIHGIANWNTSLVTTTRNTFASCTALTEANLSGWNTVKDKTFYQMFYKCTSLVTVDICGWNTSAVTTMQAMFQNCSSLVTIFVSDGTDWSTLKATSTNMFNGCTSLVGGYGTKYKAANITSTYARVDKGGSKAGYFTAKEAAASVMSLQLNETVELEAIDETEADTIEAEEEPVVDIASENEPVGKEDIVALPEDDVDEEVAAVDLNEGILTQAGFKIAKSPTAKIKQICVIVPIQKAA